MVSPMTFPFLSKTYIKKSIHVTIETSKTEGSFLSWWDRSVHMLDYISSRCRSDSGSYVSGHQLLLRRDGQLAQLFRRGQTFIISGTVIMMHIFNKSITTLQPLIIIITHNIIKNHSHRLHSKFVSGFFVVFSFMIYCVSTVFSSNAWIF